MTEFEWEKQARREEVASLLRGIAEGLDAGGHVELEQDSWELKLDVPDELELELTLEVEEDETELEIELSRSRAPTAQPASADEESAE